MKTLKRSCVLAVAFSALLAGCGRQLTEGEIVSKHHEPAQDIMMFIPIAMSCGQNCTTTMMIPYWVHDDEDWILTVTGQDEKGRTLTEDWYVTEQEYNAAPVGRHEVFDGKTASKSDEHEKLRKADS